MYIQQLYTGCLAEAAYYLESEGQAAIIDPLRETAPYLELAASRGAEIRYVLETHFHADFVSGHLDLARKTGAEIVYGPGARAQFDIHVATDGEELPLGKLRIRVLHTPGHTQESSCFLLLDEAGNPHSVYTGDTLFIGDVGRPDLAVKSDLSREDLAGMLYDSLHNKVLTLPDDVIVYPGHGAGSQCGKHLSDETESTIGDQKRTNYALQPMTRDEFVQVVTDGLVAPPQYFPKNAVINKTGYESIDTVMERNLTFLSPAAFEAAMANAQVLDGRDKESFADSYISGSLSIGLDGDFAVWVGTLIENLQEPLLLIAPEGREEEMVLRLARVGYENVIGLLEGGLAAWQASGRNVQQVEEIPAAAFVNMLPLESARILDVRRAAEAEGGLLPGALNIPLADLSKRLHEIDPTVTWYINCHSGYRAITAISLLKAEGFSKLVHVQGGYKALKEAGAQMVVPVKV